MEYQVFLKELDGYLGKLDWIGKYEILRKGMKANGDKELQLKISNSNRTYFNKEAEALLDDFVFVEDKERSMMCRSKLRGLFDDVQKNGWKAVDQWLHESFGSTDVKQKELLNSIHDYKKMKDKLRVRLINFADNSMKLKGAVYRIVGDMALELCISLGYRPEGHVSVKVSEELLRDWKIDEDTAYRIAMQNTQAEAEAVVNIGRFGRIKEIRLDEAANVKSPVWKEYFYVTTSKKVNGATVIAYPGVKEKIADLVKEDYYVVFVDTEIAYIHPVSTAEPQDLLETMQDYRKTFPLLELLSRKIYRYHRNTKELEMLPM